MINVRNIKNYDGCGVYIGRGSIFGNPFVIGKDGNRGQVLAQYKRYLWDAIKKENELYHAIVKLCDKFVRDGGNLTLICHCDPLPCHGHIMRDCIYWMLGVK